MKADNMVCINCISLETRKDSYTVEGPKGFVSERKTEHFYCMRYPKSVEVHLPYKHWCIEFREV